MKKILKKNISCIILTLLIIITFSLEWIVVMHPANHSELPTGYNMDNVIKHLKEISKEPHSTLYHQQAKVRVCTYIENELKKCGVIIQEYNYYNIPTRKNIDVNLTNIYGVLDAPNENEKYLLLMAHYDSAGSNPQEDTGFSCGMADDGYGIATIIETIRFIKANQNQMELGIKVLITDGEEIGLLGSEQAVKNNPELFDNVVAAINIEARGTSGPVLCIGMNGNESNILNWYKKSNVNSANSIVTSLYGEGDRSDFFNLRKLDIPGIDIAAIDKVENYHTTRDSIQNMDITTLHQYGCIVATLTENLVTGKSPASFDTDKSQATFPLFGNISVKCDLSTLITFNVISIVISIIVVIRKALKSNNKIVLLKAFIRKLIVGLTTLLLLTLTAFILSLITGTTFILAHMGSFAGDHLIMILFPIVAALFIVMKGYKCGTDVETERTAFLCSLTILCIFTVAFIPAAGFIFLAHPLYAVACWVSNELISKILWGIALIISTVFLAQIVVLLYMAFSIAMLGVCSWIIGLIAYGIRAIRTPFKSN